MGIITVPAFMGTQSRDPGAADETVTLTDSGGWIVARDETSGVASQGETKAEALANLAEALELHEQDIPGDVDDELEPADAPWF